MPGFASTSSLRPASDPGNDAPAELRIQAKHLEGLLERAGCLGDRVKAEEPGHFASVARVAQHRRRFDEPRHHERRNARAQSLPGVRSVTGRAARAFGNTRSKSRRTTTRRTPTMETHSRHAAILPVHSSSTQRRSASDPIIPKPTTTSGLPSRRKESWTTRSPILLPPFACAPTMRTRIATLASLWQLEGTSTRRSRNTQNRSGSILTTRARI